MPGRSTRPKPTGQARLTPKHLLRSAWSQQPSWQLWPSAQKGRLFGDLSDLSAALNLILIGALFAVTAVIPRLKSDDVKDKALDNYIYFGHAQHWEATDLEVALKEREILPVISRQIVVMADIAWQKHRWVQRSCSQVVRAASRS